MPGFWLWMFWLKMYRAAEGLVFGGCRPGFQWLMFLKAGAFAGEADEGDEPEGGARVPLTASTTWEQLQAAWQQDPRWKVCPLVDA